MTTSMIDFNLPADFTKLANARLLPATVTAVNRDNTLNLTLFGQAIVNVPANYHCHHQHIDHARRVFLVDDVVICLYTGQGSPPSASNLTVLGFPGGYLRDCAPPSGFISYPRSGAIGMHPYYDHDSNEYLLPGISAGGFIKDAAWTQLGFQGVYPLIDSDRASFILDPVYVEAEAAAADSENYGNVCWIGVGEKPPVLSWKGPPNGFSISGAFNIPGFSRAETVVNEKQYFTTFGVHIYRSGDILCHGPQWNADNEMATLVVGACYSSDAQEKAWLVAITVTDKATGFFLQVWRSDNAGQAWQMIGEFPATSRARLPAYIDGAGKLFVYETQRYQIAADVASVAISGAAVPAAPAGTRTVTGTGGYESTYEFHGSGYCWPGMGPGGLLEYSSFSADASFMSTGNGHVTPATTAVPVYRGNPATEVTLLLGGGAFPPCGPPDDYLVFTAEPNGSYCRVVWNDVDCVDGLVAAKIKPECGAGWSVSVTLMPQNVTATYTQEAELTPVVTVSGPDAPTAGSQYGASGGTGPHTFSITKGSIDPDTGIITSVAGACGVATVTATDFCGKTGSVEVRMPNGSWSPTWWITNPPVNKWAYHSEWAGEAVGGSRAYYLMFTAFSSGGGTYEDVLADMQAQAAEQSLTFYRLDWNDPPAISVAYGYLTKSQSWGC